MTVCSMLDSHHGSIISSGDNYLIGHPMENFLFQRPRGGQLPLCMVSCKEIDNMRDVPSIALFFKVYFSICNIFLQPRAYFLSFTRLLDVLKNQHRKDNWIGKKTHNSLLPRQGHAERGFDTDDTQIYNIFLKIHTK